MTSTQISPQLAAAVQQASEQQIQVQVRILIVLQQYKLSKHYVSSHLNSQPLSPNMQKSTLQRHVKWHCLKNLLAETENDHWWGFQMLRESFVLIINRNTFLLSLMLVALFHTALSSTGADPRWAGSDSWSGVAGGFSYPTASIRGHYNTAGAAGRANWGTTPTSTSTDT